MIIGMQTPWRRTRGLAQIAGLTLAMLALSAPGTASAEEPTCFGKKATIVAKPGVERIEGTAGDDVIVGNERDQIISGGGGDDRICGKGGDDHIYGDAGDNRLSGGRGADWIRGQDGDDLIQGGPGADTLNVDYEENGDDEVFGGPGDDIMSAGHGEDKVFGESGDDRLFAGFKGKEDSPLVDLFSGGRGTDTCEPHEEDKLRSCEVRP